MEKCLQLPCVGKGVLETEQNSYSLVLYQEQH